MGRLLFLIHYNYLPVLINDNVDLFAYDSVVSREVNNCDVTTILSQSLSPLLNSALYS